jgi:hypothetical protein
MRGSGTKEGVAQRWKAVAFFGLQIPFCVLCVLCGQSLLFDVATKLVAHGGEVRCIGVLSFKN